MSEDSRPIVGISMGDPYGNGPEITVKALSDPGIYERCRPVVIGDSVPMRYALAVAALGKRNFCLCNATPLFCHVD